MLWRKLGGSGGRNNWVVRRAIYDGVLLNVDRGSTDPPEGMFFKPDGTVLYVSDDKGHIWQYSLSTAWDLSTAVYDNKTFHTNNGGDAVGIFLKPDGLKLYVLDSAFSNSDVNQYTLSAAWDISTASFDGVSLDVLQSSGDGFDIFIKPDGSKLYYLEQEGDSIDPSFVYQYGLSTAWDLSTAVYDNIQMPLREYLGSISSQGDYATGLFFKPDGKKIYITNSDGSDSAVLQYGLSTAWDLSTKSFEFQTTLTNGRPEALAFNPDGSKMYVLDAGGYEVHQYSTV